jgi:ferredoxin
MTRIANVQVLADTCVRAALCTETCPQVFEFPPATAEEPEPPVRVRDDAPRHYEALEAELHQAARDCPVHAIVIGHGDEVRENV